MIEVALIEAPVVALPEAPASVNVRIMMGGREVQWTLRDTDEGRLGLRLAALLAQYPVETPTVPAPQAQEGGEGWCAVHRCQMKHQQNKKGGWWSHKTASGAWCKGR